MGQATGDPNSSKAKAAVVDIDDVPFDGGRTVSTPAPKADSTPASGDSKAQDILAMIRNRQK
jgi:hypothetical protein